MSKGTSAKATRPITSQGYERPPRSPSTYVDDHVATLTGDCE
jgi:hypothetical protein